MDDILKEKEEIVNSLATKKEEYEAKLREAGTTTDWKLPVLSMIVVGSISALVASNFEGWPRIAAFFITWFGIFAPGSYIVVKRIKAKLKEEIKRVDHQLEEARIDLARIRRRVEE